MNTAQIAARPVELCRQGQYEQVQNALHTDDAVSIEMAGLPPEASGAQQWTPTNTAHYGGHP